MDPVYSTIQIEEMHKQACDLVADMHTAAMGKRCLPVLGLVEDVADLRARHIKDVEDLFEKLRKVHALLAHVIRKQIQIWENPDREGDWICSTSDDLPNTYGRSPSEALHKSIEVTLGERQ